MNTLPKFKNSELLKLAFIHRSFLNETKEKLESNERLEFLGDSILSFQDLVDAGYKIRFEKPFVELVDDVAIINETVAEETAVEENETMKEDEEEEIIAPDEKEEEEKNTTKIDEKDESEHTSGKNETNEDAKNNFNQTDGDEHLKNETILP